MMEKLALMQLHHLSASVLERRDKRTLTRIETIHNIWTFHLQQSLQPLLMLLTPPEVSCQLLEERLPIVVRIINPQVYHLDSRRERIKRRSLMLVRSHHSHIPAHLLNKIPHLVEKDALHAAGVICRVDLI